MIAGSRRSCGRSCACVERACRRRRRAPRAASIHARAASGSVSSIRPSMSKITARRAPVRARARASSDAAGRCARGSRRGAGRRGLSPPCAWQIAQASASAASGDGAPGRSSRRAHHLLHLLLRRALPWPTTACLTCRAVYSATGRPASTAAAIAAPRAWPSSSVECGLTLTNTFSTATSVGPLARRSRARGRAAMTPRRIRQRVVAVAADAAAGDVAQRAARPTSMTPKPVTRRPGSMPRMRRDGSRRRRSSARRSTARYSTTTAVPRAP